MTIAHVIRGPLLNPRTDGSVAFFPDAALIGDDHGKIVAVGHWSDVVKQYPAVEARHRVADGWIIPPMLDAHIHIPQHPIRGRFLEGISGSPDGGPVLAGLARNVFPAEGRCADAAIARAAIEDFREDTLAHGVIGGAAYMTVHASATRAALERLAPEWFVGLVLMERFCPEYLRTDVAKLDDDVAALARDFGKRLIVTDRFAGAVDGPLRRRGVELSRRFDLRMQTHLNEQLRREGLDRRALSRRGELHGRVPSRRTSGTRTPSSPIAFTCGPRNSICSPRRLTQEPPWPIVRFPTPCLARESCRSTRSRPVAFLTHCVPTSGPRRPLHCSARCCSSFACITGARRSPRPRKRCFA